MRTDPGAGAAIGAFHSVECIKVSGPKDRLAILAAFVLLATGPVGSRVAGQAPGGSEQEAVGLHLQQAQVHLEQEQYDLAKVELQTAISLLPGIVGAYYQLGLAHWHLREFGEARAAFQTELSLGPPDAHSLYYLGRIALGEGNTAEAVARFEEVVKIGTVLDVRTRLAGGYLSLDRIGDAVELLEETVRRWPEQGDSHYLLGRAYQRQGRVEDARREFELAERWKNKLQDEIRALVELRMLLQNRNLLEAAAKTQELAASGDPDMIFGAMH